MPGWLARWTAFVTARDDAPRIEVSLSGRSGRVTYVDGPRRANFHVEFGGGDCIAWISVPGVDAWPRETGLARDIRDDMLRVAAERVHRDHAGSARYTIDDGDIAFWSR